MIKFFRKIRQNLLNEGKTSKYFKYAIGEILLVVIGILIALQINNWNEVRKQNLSVKQSLNSLLSDLKKDSIQLNDDLEFINKDLAQLLDFNERLSKNSANLDTLKQIARFEYLPFFNPSNELNRNTIVSLLSTGHLEYFDDAVKNDILKHNTNQLTLVKVMDENVDIFLSIMTSGEASFQSENKAFNGAVIRGPLLELYWEKFDDDVLLSRFITNLSHKSMMQSILKSAKERLLNETIQLIDNIKSYQETL
ncbi:DUF6090 family protein [Paucihalobacter sp.]|uniref:DUF6090 family protein n=1 Tax=Paucihalobacter sp. TaxID=2850405 RepID=UPI003D161CA3